MNIWQKDFRVTWRRPLIWVILAMASFIAAWLFWQILDRYTQLQLSFQALPNPPSITQALWVPYLLIIAKLTMLLIAMTGGLSIAQERTQKTLWYLLINRINFWPVVIAKVSAQWPIYIWIFLQLILVILLLSSGGKINAWQILYGSIGLFFFTAWLMALGQLISSYCHSTGTAVLLNIMVFVLMWMLNGQTINEEYGLNWLSLVSPAHHLQWFSTGVISVSSWCYFLGGIWLFLWLTTRQLKHLRKLL